MMTRERAIQLLQCTAQPLPPEHDPEWGMLADYLERHPEVEAWFASQSPADEAARAAVSLLPELRPAVVPTPLTVVRPPPTRWTRRRWLTTGVAAAVAVGGGGFYYALERPTSFANTDGPTDFAGFREDMARFADRLFQLDKKSATTAPLIQYLTEQAATTPPDWSQLPASIANKRARGCRTIAWGRQKIGLICFYRDASQVVHLFSIGAAALQGSYDTAAMRQPVTIRGRECCGWQQGEMVYLLIGMKLGTPVADLV